MMTDQLNIDGVKMHDERAHLFRKDYSDKLENYYASAFTYGRKKILQDLDSMIKMLPAGSKILDIGCGTGYFMHYLSKKGFRVYGVDLSREMIQNLRTIYSDLHVQPADARQLPFEDETFDAVISIETLRYFEDRLSPLQEAHRVLKKEGVGFFTVAPFYSLNFYGFYNRLCHLLKLKKSVSCYQTFETVHSFEGLLKKTSFYPFFVRGHFFGFYFLLDKIFPQMTQWFLKHTEALDDWLSKRNGLRNFSNHLVAMVRKQS